MTGFRNVLRRAGLHHCHPPKVCPAGLAVAMLAAVSAASARGVTSECATSSSIAADEEIMFFPTFASWSADGPAWTARIHAWVYEPDRESVVREQAFQLLAAVLELPVDSAEFATLRRRAWPFVVDNERDETVVIRVGAKCETLGVTDEAGHLQAQFALPSEAVPPEPSGPGCRWLDFEAHLAEGDARRFAGRIQLVPPEGPSVISDIDDTIRRSEVQDRKRMFRAALLEKYEAVPGMAQAYRQAAEAGLVFHYVSASPWQLYVPLEEFMRAEGFPAGSLHLRTARLEPASILALLDSPLDFKTAEIEAILASFPQRRFILVGDSTQDDPEVYATIARRHPGQVRRIFIRTLPPSEEILDRLRATFVDLPPGSWRVFQDGAGLDLTAEP